MSWAQAHRPALGRHRALGAEIREEGGALLCALPGGHMAGCEINLSIPSVGATENAMLAACGAEGTTVISNAAREPEIVDLQAFLLALGAEVRGAGSSVVTVRGGNVLHGGEHTVMPDRIVAATLLSAVASAGGEAEILGTIIGSYLRSPPCWRRRAAGSVAGPITSPSAGWSAQGRAPHSHGALPRLSHRRAAPGHGRSDQERGDHRHCGEYVRKPLPACG